MLLLRRFRDVVIRLNIIAVVGVGVSFLPSSSSSSSFHSTSHSLAVNIAEFLQVFNLGDLLALSQSTSLFASGPMDAISTLAAVFLHLTRSALHASVAPLWLILLTVVVAVVVVVADNAGVVFVVFVIVNHVDFGR